MNKTALPLSNSKIFAKVSQLQGIPYRSAIEFNRKLSPLWQGICYFSIIFSTVNRMRLVFLLCIAVFPFLGQAQILDGSSTQPLQIGSDNTLSPNPSNQGTSLRMPSLLEPNTSKTNLRDSLTARNIKMLPDRELVQAGHGLIIDTKVGNKEKGKGSTEHFGDMYLGDIKHNGNYVGIVARDHEFVDGDRIKITINDRVIDANFLLTGGFKGINVDLEKGFNRLDFEALNQGSSGPNTAQVSVFDEKGQLIYANRWNLSTGSKATLIIVKE
ncbi:hypothetical protein U1E44_05440 [Arenibacter sp. GZD96]|uniref:hypothetical protein n=1 Tax=Aurantibrevibacter litoralis TaxID=3106030 RepID=UPI002AFDDD33|nr:hypothetical protein [Arenibacter sp. GZD-96]MEA1785524.1 hypothetical protein [Arenibacter sp. GZD-96]